MKQEKMTPSVVLKTHKLLMLNQKGLYPDEKGYFRHVSVYIGNKEAMNHVKIDEYIERWCIAMNRTDWGVLQTKELMTKSELIPSLQVNHE